MDKTTISKTTFLILSDTHNLEVADLPPFLKNQPKVDVLLHCGDLTYVGGISAYEKALRLLGTFEAELKLVIAGNHDISLDEEYWMDNLDRNDDPDEPEKSVNAMTGDLAQKMGVTYLTEGLHHFTLKNGKAFSLYCSPYQPECGGWAFSYKRCEDRFNFDVAAGSKCIATEQSAVPDSVDIMMTHGPPKGFLDVIPSKNEHGGCEALLRAVQRARPLLHCFGHIHEGCGLKQVEWEGETHADRIHKATVRLGDVTGAKKLSVARKKSTIMVNAAIMDDSSPYRPTHAPWLVELEL